MTAECRLDKWVLRVGGILSRQTINQIGPGVQVSVAALQKIVDHICVGIGFGNYDTAHLVIRDGFNAADR